MILREKCTYNEAMINIAIVEDNINEYSLLKNSLDKYACSYNVKFNITYFSSAIEFLNSYKKQFQLVFMDIELPDMNGMEASHKLRDIDKDVVIVFVTNLSNYAINGYEVDALDFVVKPIKYETFAIKLTRIINKINIESPYRIEVYDVDHILRIINLAEVYYLEVSGHYLIFHLENEEFKTRMSLKSFEEKYDLTSFFKPNVYALVNLKYVNKVDGDDIFLGKFVIKISRLRKKDFLEAVSKYLGATM